MEQINLEYDSIKDVQEVDQFGFIDLAKAFLTGTIDANVNVQDLQFNEIDDPLAIDGKPRSAFDMIDAGVEIARREGIQQSSAKEEGD